MPEMHLTPWLNGEASRRTFCMEDQEDFARLSGDRNPLHLDPLLARRLMFGQAVVHGIHLLLWSMDHCLSGGTIRLGLANLRVDFRRHLGLGEEVVCRVRRSKEDWLEVELEAEGMPVVWWEASLRPAGSPPTNPLPPLTEAGECHELTSQEASRAQGRLELGLDHDLFRRMFPALAAALPAWQVAALLATTRLVGMHCPGLHSVYSGLELSFYPLSGQGARWLQYRVSRHEPVFSLLWLAVAGHGMQGTVKAFLRPQPRRQADMDKINALVPPGAFQSWHALVIGGSRGLGEVAAKLLAAGGARVILTYHQGREDALRVVEAITQAGGRARCLRLDVLSAAESLLADLGGEVPNCLCYFATPFIAKGQSTQFSIKAFQVFCDYYVKGFLQAVEALLHLNPSGLRVLYPSSVAVEELPPDMHEYAAAKLAGEGVCQFLLKAHPAGLRLCSPRLPRLATDQMPTFLPVESGEPVDYILEALRKLDNMAF